MPVERVLLCTSLFPRDTDDRITARFVLDLAVALARLAHVTVLAPASDASEWEERWGDITVLRYRYFVPRAAQRLGSGEGARAAARTDFVARMQVPLVIGAQFLSLPYVIRARKIDVINSHWLVPQGLTAALWSHMLGIPHVATAHAADVALLQRSRWGRSLARYIMEHTNVFLPVSTYLAERVEELVGSPVHHHVVPMGVSTERFRVQPAHARGQRILFVGKLVPKKGVEFLVGAIRLLRERGVPVQLDIVGGGPLEPSIRELIQQHDLGSSIQLLGWRHNHDLPDLYNQADVVCVPSIVDDQGETEGMPVVVQEALASGAIVVASDVSGIPDIIQDGVNGFLVPQRDAQKLASGLETALRLDSAARLRVSQAARTTALENTWERIAERYMSAFEEAQ